MFDPDLRSITRLGGDAPDAGGDAIAPTSGALKFDFLTGASWRCSSITWKIVSASRGPRARPS